MKRVGNFSLARWGVGGSVIVVLLSALTAVTFYKYLSSNAPIYAFLGSLSGIAVALIVFVKLNEEIEPTRAFDEGVVGKAALVVEKITPERPGVIRLGSQTWSAKSKETIEAGSQVVIVEREGIYVFVKNTSESKEKETSPNPNRHDA